MAHPHKERAARQKSQIAAASVGMTPMEFDPNVSNDLLESINEQLDRGEMVTFESRHRRKD
ncbi:MAG: hypothetical protein JO232_11820 [Verrucomicrobia bacterium]|nr:hypothetical protein [Verrucomicrobiota bacterium]